MFTETISLYLIYFLSSSVVIYFLIFYIQKISDFKIPIDFLKGLESKNEDLEEKLMNQEQEHENNFSIVQKIIECIISQNQSIFLFISACFMMLMLLIELLIVIILEDYGKNLLISGSFFAGCLISFIMQYVLLQTGIKGTILVLMQANSLINQIYKIGLLLFSFFLSLYFLTIIIIIAIYKNSYLNPTPKIHDHQDMILKTTVGFCFGYFLSAFFYRNSSGIMNTGISLTTDLISKSDDSLGKNSLFNPSSITDKLFEIRNLFSHDFMDICCTLLLIITILINFIYQSLNLINLGFPIYFPFVFFSMSFILVFLISKLALKFDPFGADDSNRFVKSHFLLNYSISTIVSLILLYIFAIENFPLKFSFFTEIPTTGLKNLTLLNISSNHVVACLFIGVISEKICSFLIEYCTKVNSNPIKSMVRICEIGPCFNLVASNIITSISFPCIIIVISIAIFASYGYMGYFGVSLASFGAISNILVVFSNSFVGNYAAICLKIANSANLTGISLKRLFYIQWETGNYYSHFKSVVFLGICLGGFAGIGQFLTFFNKIEMLNFKSLQIFGLIIGFANPFLFYGISLNGGQGLTINLIFKCKEILGSRKADLGDHDEIMNITIKNSILTVFLVPILNFLIIALLGYFLGASCLYTYQFGFLLSSLYLIYNGTVSGLGLSNAKQLIENKAYVEKEGSVFASTSIGESISISFKNSAAGLVTFVVMNWCFCQIFANNFGNNFRIAELLNFRSEL